MIPHDPGAFTQGLEIRCGYLWESTGIYGQSTFRKTDLQTGEVLDLLRLPDSVFAEGFTFLDDSTVCLLSWRENTAFVLNPWTMEIEEELYLNTEGWGICNAGEYLVQSDGTAILRFRDPVNFSICDSISVTLNGQPQFYLNELEYLDGQIIANQWGTSRILFINPENGHVERFINLGSVVPASGGVLNGIASGEDGILYCTGKNWPVTLILDNL
ncbi:MAG: glutaminyl-peptide cyclotransferase [Candidatus Sabulitectum sp.]|nr:glutaminyl-peptide cyclotransferase [Candidatus Sabulitectum sp.]